MESIPQVTQDKLVQLAAWFMLKYGVSAEDMRQFLLDVVAIIHELWTIESDKLEKQNGKIKVTKTE